MATTPSVTPNPPTVPTVLRNGGLAELVDMLKAQQVHKHDVVAPAVKLRSVDTNLVITGTEAVLSDDGVTSVDGTYRITDTFVGGIAAKLKIPTEYLRRLSDSRPDMFDMTVNGFLRGSKTRVAPDGTRTQQHPADPRSFLVRTFTGDDSTPGVARAMLSDQYGIVDNLDALTATLDGVRAAGVQVEIDRAELTERNMHVRIKCEEVSALAPELLRGYRSPFTGESGDALPVVWAGLVITNSEVGAGAYTITPQAIVRVCSNGVSIARDMVRRTHIGARMDEGVVRWSAETATKMVELIRSQTRDAVRTFLDVDYLRKVIADLEKTSGTPVTDAAKTVQSVGRTLKYTDEQIDGVLDHFIKGGQVTAGGVMQAITSCAQTAESADTQAEMESTAIRAMELAATSR